MFAVNGLGDRDHRVATLQRRGFALAGVALIAGLIAAAVSGVQGLLWLLPLVLAGGVVYATVRAQYAPLWMINVPDNEVWMILDEGNHIDRFVGSGRHSITAVEHCEPAPDQGVIPISIELDRVTTGDHYIYRVLVSVTAFLDPLQAQHRAYATLRTLNRDMIGQGIHDDIIDVVRHALAQQSRQSIDPTALVATIGEAIGEVMDMRRPLGVVLAEHNPIRVSLTPPDEVLAARSAQWVRETETEAHIKHLSELLEMAGAHNMSVGDLGRLHFALNPQSGMQVVLGGDHGLFAPGDPVRKRSDAPEASMLQSPTLPRALPARNAPPALAASIGSAEELTSKQPSLPRPITLPEAIPSRPNPAPAPQERPATQPARPTPDPNVIETEQDESGTYVPADPILRPRKKK
ncbi:MAG: hypothetical protein ACYDEO_25630 [Aggregatilineales bacterium]